MADTTGRPSGAVAEPVKRRPRLADFFIRLVKEKPLGTAGGIIVLLLLFTGIFADVLAPYPFDQNNLADRLAGPSADHWLGADQLGRDLLSRIIYGARISMIVALAASALNVLVATVVGLSSGYLGGWFDLIIQRFVDAYLAFPFLIILIIVVNIVGTGMWPVIFVIGISGGFLWIRVVRSAVISIKENVYFEASRAIGASLGRILTRHVLPNIVPVLIIIFSLSMAGNILAEASLSFLGFGIPPPAPSWGGMLSTEGRRYMYEAPWLAIWPGLALSIVVYGINMWGDALRDLLDPRLRGGVGRYRRAKAKMAGIKEEKPGSTA